MDRAHSNRYQHRRPVRRLFTGMRTHFWSSLRWLGGFEPTTLGSILIVVVAGWAFIELADSVVGGETHRFDPWLLRALRSPDNPAVPIGPRWLQGMARDVTALGGYFCLIFFTLITTGYLWLDRKRHLSEFLIGSALSGFIVSMVLKSFFQRPRPDIVPHLEHVISSSFPSGHSMNAAVIYLTLGSIVATSVARKSLKAYAIAVGVSITMLVGVSRVFLGVHYPTDVLAGWMAGLIWAILCSFVARVLQQRGTVERPDPPTAEPAASSPGTDDEG